MAPKRRQAKPFRVFEAGSGKRPIGLFLQAERAKERGLHGRRFVGVDIRKVDVNQLLIKLRIGRKPSNLRLLHQDAVDAVKILPPNRQHVIFASYLLNCIMYDKPRAEHGLMQLDLVFAKLAKAALMPGGRLVLVQDRGNVPYAKEIALSLGMGFHAIEIPDAKARKSPALAIRSRSTPAKRLNWMKRYCEMANLSGPAAQGAVQEMMQNSGLKREEDYAKPTIMIYRKRRQGEKGLLLATAGCVSQGLTELSPAEKKIVEEILAEQK
jgi:hypothetical protein